MQCPCYATDSGPRREIQYPERDRYPRQPGHQAGSTSGIPGLGKPLKVAYTNPTMDQVMAYSSNFYSTEDREIADYS